MSLNKSSIRRIVSAVAVSGCLLSSIPSLTLAQSLPGLTLWGGVKREEQLGYRLDFGGQSDSIDRYRLRIPGSKLELGVAQFVISYPDYYKGKFDPKEVEVIVKGKSVPLQEVNWDQENRQIQIYLKESIEAGNGVELMLSNVKNPPFGGMYYFECRTLSPGDIPLPRYIGTWILSIS